MHIGGRHGDRDNTADLRIISCGMCVMSHVAWVWFGYVADLQTVHYI